MAPLNVLGFGLTLGILWGCAILLLGVVSSIWHKGEKAVTLFGKVYVGFRPTLLGSLTGALWGFVDGVISGVLIAWIYNLIVS